MRAGRGSRNEIWAPCGDPTLVRPSGTSHSAAALRRMAPRDCAACFPVVRCSGLRQQCHTISQYRWKTGKQEDCGVSSCGLFSAASFCAPGSRSCTSREAQQHLPAVASSNLPVALGALADIRTCSSAELPAGSRISRTGHMCTCSGGNGHRMF